jgi:competence ComEA-like helix-hairpin-helix protein
MDINKASAEELENAFQVDGVRARYIVEHRNKIGPFQRWDDVKQVPGFEDKMVENLQAAGLTLQPARKDEPSHSSRKTHARSMDLNSASAEDLEAVAQIDGERARYLIEARSRLGGFKSWEEVKREAPSFEDGMIANLQEAGFRI